jgi:hypothetical protein
VIQPIPPTITAIAPTVCTALRMYSSRRLFMAHPLAGFDASRGRNGCFES